MNIDPPAILALPFDLLFIITQYVADPCDLLALRRSCSTFNNHLKKRFDITFRSRPCMRSSTIDKLLYWAATHNYERFARRTMAGIHWTDDDTRLPTMLHSGARASLSYSGVAQAMYQTARYGDDEMFLYLRRIACVGFPHCGDGYSLERECFEIAVSEGNTSFINWMIGEASSTPLDGPNVEGKTALVVLMETHNVEPVEHFLSYLIPFGELSKALMAYAHSLEGHREGWCQRILHAVLNSALDPLVVGGEREYLEDDIWWVDSRTLLDILRRAGKRRCKPECSVWDPKMLGEFELHDLEHKLKILSLEKINLGSSKKS